jgi:hypothetical protein
MKSIVAISILIRVILPHLILNPILKETLSNLHLALNYVPLSLFTFKDIAVHSASNRSDFSALSFLIVDSIFPQKNPAQMDDFNSDEDDFCPLCMEEIEVDDKYFKPCPCGYQVSLDLSFVEAT